MRPRLPPFLSPPDQVSNTVIAPPFFGFLALQFPSDSPQGLFPPVIRPLHLPFTTVQDSLPSLSIGLLI